MLKRANAIVVGSHLLRALPNQLLRNVLNLSPSWYRNSHRRDLGFGRAVHENGRVKLVCETAPFTLYLQQLVSRLKESPGLPLIVEFAEPIIGPGDLKVMRRSPGSSCPV